MTDFTGTDGNDNLVGTDGNDRFFPLFGTDTVDGLAGFDTLTVDYRTFANAATGTLVRSSTIAVHETGSMQGIVYSAHRRNDTTSQQSVSFSNIEALDYYGSMGSEYFWITANELSARDLLKINAGAGTDYLFFNLSAVRDVTLIADGLGAMWTSWANITGFEQFHLTVGGGQNHIVTGVRSDLIRTSAGSVNHLSTGNGEDSVMSDHSIDAIIFGERGFWTGAYDQSTDDLIFSYNGLDRRGALSNGTTLDGLVSVLTLTTGSGNDQLTLANASATLHTGGGNDDVTLRNATADITLGEGDDHVTLTSLARYVDGGPGIDRLSADIGSSSNNTLVIKSMGGAFSARTPEGSLRFSEFEHVTLKLTGSDIIVIEADVRAILRGATLSVIAFNNDPAELNNVLKLNYSGVSNATFVRQADGTAISNYGTFDYFDAFEITLGEGLNTVVTGLHGDKIVTVQGGQNSIATVGGDDTIISNGSIDRIDGGSGRDAWIGQYQSSTVALDFSWGLTRGTGELSNGTTLKAMEDVSFYSGSGDDQFLTRGHMKYLDGGAGIDTLIGRFDSINTSGVRFELSGSLIRSNSGSYHSIERFDLSIGAHGSRIKLGEQNDIVRSEFGELYDPRFQPNQIQTGGGDDIISSSRAKDQIDGGAGFDRWTGFYDQILYSWMSEPLLLSDPLTLTWDANGVGLLSNGAQLTSIEQIEFRAGTGNDVINGWNGDDVLYGGGGNDFLNGQRGDDTLVGGDGDDIFSFRLPSNLAGFDIVEGGDGIDTIRAETANIVIALESFSGVERIGAGGHAGVTLSGSQNANVFDFSQVTVTGISRIMMLGGDDSVIGSSAADIILGGAGRDTLSGGGKSDTLVGGLDADVLSGGVGGDVFDYDGVFESRFNVSADMIVDFQRGVDTLDLSTIDANTTAAGNQDFRYIGETAFSRMAGELRIDSSSVAGQTQIYGDVNGDGIADLHIILANRASPRSDDYIL